MQNRQNMPFFYHQGWSMMKSSVSRRILQPLFGAAWRTFYFTSVELLSSTCILFLICCLKCIWKCCVCFNNTHSITLLWQNTFISLLWAASRSHALIISGFFLSLHLNQTDYIQDCNHIHGALCLGCWQKSFSVILTDNQCVIIDGSFTWLNALRKWNCRFSFSA